VIFINGKTFTAFCFFILFVNFSNCQKCSCLAKDALSHNGEYCKVTGKVAEINIRTNDKGKLVHLNIGGKYPEQELSVVIWENSLKNFPSNLDSAYTGKNISVYGIIKVFKNKPSINVKKESDIEILK
jgi:hypothetical protein